MGDDACLSGPTALILADPEVSFGSGAITDKEDTAVAARQMVRMIATLWDETILLKGKACMPVDQ
jgi:hypothetical protein